MLLGTLTMDLTSGGFSSSSLVIVEIGALSSYIAGDLEVPFGSQTLLSAPEPPSFVLLVLALAALATVRIRRNAWWSILDLNQ